MVRRSAGILFVSGTRLLLLKRASCSNNAGLWGLPGGRVEEGESEWLGALRETREEVGAPPLCRPIGEIVVRRPKRLYRIFVVRVPRSERLLWRASLNEEHDEFRWAKLSWCLKYSDQLHPVVAAVVNPRRARKRLLSLIEGEAPTEAVWLKVPKARVQVLGCV